MKVAEMFPSEYLRGDDLEGDTTLTIRGVRMEELKRRDGTSETKPVMYFTDEKRKLVLNQTNAHVIAECLQSDQSSTWKGKRITFYATPVDAFGEMRNAVRVRPTIAEPPPMAADDFGDDDIPF